MTRIYATSDEIQALSPQTPDHVECWTFATSDGRMPGKQAVQWTSRKEEAEEFARVLGGSIIVGLDAEGSIVYTEEI